MDYMLVQSLDCEKYYTTLFTHRTQRNSLTTLTSQMPASHTNLSCTFVQLFASTRCSTLMLHVVHSGYTTGCNTLDRKEKNTSVPFLCKYHLKSRQRSSKYCESLNARYSSHTLTKFEFSGQISGKCSNIEFHEILSSWSRVVPCGQPDRQTDRRDRDVTQQIVAFHNVSNAPKTLSAIDRRQKKMVHFTGNQAPF